MPPASKKFLAKLARAVKSAAFPSAARKIFAGRRIRPRFRRKRRAAARTALRAASAAALSDGSLASGSAAVQRQDRGAARGYSGNSLVPVRMSVRRAMAFCRSARTAATLLWFSPASSADQTPPAFSISLKQRPGGRANLVRHASSAPEPAAGSATRARFDSSRRTSWVLRATRRQTRRADRAPPCAAAPRCCRRRRGRLRRPRPTCAAHSRRIALRHHAPRGSAATMAGLGARPHAASTRAHNFRTARNLAMVINWSASADSRK